MCPCTLSSIQAGHRSFLNNFIPVSEPPHFSRLHDCLYYYFYIFYTIFSSAYWFHVLFLVLFDQTYVESYYHFRIVLSEYINIFLFIIMVSVHMCMHAHLHTYQTTVFVEVLTFTRPTFTYVNTYLITPLAVNCMY